MSNPLRGSCLCGEATYVVNDAFHYAYLCHCSQCRRATGSAFKPLAGIERDALRLTCDAAVIHRHGSALAHDAHCARCGSLLYSLVRDAGWVHVAMGTLIDSPRIRPSAHIFVGSMAAWDTITDALPQHAGFPDS